ncbi:MAG TPA: YhbY family RNA-binding protein, partial [Pseudomonadales bacterium]|nr:YhbY family RNA-binding protein [Pseudomonadales bacterium]
MSESSTPIASDQRRMLRRIGHHLQPVVIVGDEGLSSGVLKETERALDDHELIKVRLPAADKDMRRAMGEALCAATGAVLIQSIGR